ncbi:hypothetical protein [Streptomyces catenulae]|uniref:PE-PGRS family protein n=1 Tax=Streptomyces catenulae TaxID=66875 RepID=A0ABV2Z1G7_9ACTN|nr:hypothetical protein [Streptomyces catenulae]
MTSEQTAAAQHGPVYTQAPHAPWREILRHRWSGRRDRALVLCDREGGYHVLTARRGRARGAEGASEGPCVVQESAPPVRVRGGYESAFHVRLTEESGVRDVGLPTAYGTEPVDVHATWWVHDPQQVVRARTRHGWGTVRRDLEQRLQNLQSTYEGTGRGLDAAEVLSRLGGTETLSEAGLSYRVTDVSPRAVAGELRLGRVADAVLPFSWSANGTADYDFCARAVRSGPVTLAALWLVRHPDQIERVLSWAVDNQRLLRAEADWEDGMAALLGNLSEQEKKALSDLVRDRLTALGRKVPDPKRGGPVHPGANGWPVGAGGKTL